MAASDNTEPADASNTLPPNRGASDLSSATIRETSDGGQKHMIVLDEIVDRDVVGQYTGQVKWFNDRLGYGFCTICSGDLKGTDIFVHHSGIRPMNSNYKTLRKGEYVNFNMVNGHNGPQAIDVTGICGGSLMCDVLPVRRAFPLPPPGPGPRKITQDAAEAAATSSLPHH